MNASPSFALELPSVSTSGNGNGYAGTRRASVAANSLKIECDQKGGERESVSKVETVDVTVIKAGMLIGSACGALRRR